MATHSNKKLALLSINLNSTFLIFPELFPSHYTKQNKNDIFFAKWPSNLLLWDDAFVWLDLLPINLSVVVLTFEHAEFIAQRCQNDQLFRESDIIAPILYLNVNESSETIVQDILVS